MTTTDITPAKIQEALQQTKLDWLLRFWGEDTKKQLEKIATELHKFIKAYQRRFKDAPDIFGLVEVNPLKAAAFFQPDTLLASCEMKIMVWRILLGGEIQGVDLRYRAEKKFTLTVQLVSLNGEKESYSTDKPSDFRVLRHVGIAGTEDDYVLQGYYALARPH